MPLPLVGNLSIAVIHLGTCSGFVAEATVVGIEVTTEIGGANAVDVGAVVKEVEAIAVDEDADVKVVGSPGLAGTGTLVHFWPCL